MSPTTVAGRCIPTLARVAPLLASVLSPGTAPPGAPGEAALLLQLAAPTLAPAAPVLALRAPAPPNVRGPARRTRPCNRCVGCAVPDCGQCIFCRDKPAFGGPNRLRKRCTARVYVESHPQKRSFWLADYHPLWVGGVN